MRKKSILKGVFSGLFFVCVTTFAVFAQNTSFTYQGKLTQSGTAANGNYEMRFTLYDQAANGFQIGTPKTISNIAVTNGIFTALIPDRRLDFRSERPFYGNRRAPSGKYESFHAARAASTDHECAEGDFFGNRVARRSFRLVRSCDQFRQT